MNNLSRFFSPTTPLRLFITASLLVVSCLAQAAGDDGPAADSEFFARVVADTLTGAIPRNQQAFKVPGVAVTVVERGKVAWSRGFGVLVEGEEQPVTGDTVMEAASLSKPFFAYIVLKMIEEGELDLDVPLVRYLAYDYIENAPKHRTITARMVLNHTSGWPNWREGGTELTHQWKSEVGGALNFGAPMQLLFDPGTQYTYSGEAFVMLQRVVEKISDQTLAHLSEVRLIKPLKLNNTGFKWKASFADNGARGHDQNGTVTDDSPGRVTDAASLVITSAGSLYTSSNDYARFLIEIMASDRASPHSLSAAAVREMLTPAIKVPDSETAVGLGWMLKTNGGDTIAYHYGNNGDFQAFTAFWPNSQNGFVIMTNASGGGRLLEAVLTDLETALMSNEQEQANGS